MKTALDWRFLKRNRGSITTRLIVSLTVTTTLLWCGGAAYATYASYRELNETFDAALREVALRLLPLAQDDLLKTDGDDSRAISRLMGNNETHLSYQLRGRSGKVLLRAQVMAWTPPSASTLWRGISGVVKRKDIAMPNEVHVVGLDIAKSVFQVHGADQHGSAIVRRKLRRDDVEQFFRVLSSCLVGLEACPGAHFWGRLLRSIGTTTSRPNVTSLLEATFGLGAEKLFASIRTGEDVNTKKPDPEVYRRVLSDLQLAPEACLCFEDSRNGLLGRVDEFDQA